MSNSDLLSKEEVTVDQISSKTLDFFTQIIEDENGSEMKVFVRHGYDIYVTKDNYPNEYAAIKGILDSFLKYYLPIYYKGKVDDTEKRIEQLSDESQALQEKIADDSERIEELINEIHELEADSKRNKELLDVANKKLMKRNEKLERIRTQLRKL